MTQGSLPADQRVVVLNPRARVLNLHNGQEDQGEHPEPDEEPDLAGEGESQETELTTPPTDLDCDLLSQEVMASRRQTGSWIEA